MRPSLSSVAAALMLMALGSTSTLSAANEDKHPLFDRIDTNHDGFISLQEWITARHEYLSKRRAEGEGEAPGGANSTMNSLNHRQTSSTSPAGTGTPVTGQHPRLQEEDENHHPLFDRIDTNHDGQISLQEWIAFRREHHGEHHRPGATPPITGTTPTTTPPLQ